MKSLILISVMSILLVSGCTTEDMKNVQDIGESIPSIISNEPSCEDRVWVYIPDKIVMKQQQGSDHLIPTGNHWIDGTSIPETGYFYEVGSETGQNVNYYYYAQWGNFGDGGIKYSKKIVSDSGEILGTRTFLMTPVLKPIEGTSKIIEQGWQTFVTTDFEIIEPRISDCVWVTDE